MSQRHLLQCRATHEHLSRITKDGEIEQLKQELKALYPNRSEAIERQKNYGVRAYFKCCEGNGHTQQLMGTIMKVSNDEKLKIFLLPLEHMKVVNGCQEEDDKSSFDFDCSLQDDDVASATIETP
ncbi:hypothetical protein EDD21DRAFT_413432 [Dissophora ornata]|nr:hypothetical protein BGZ58_007523 [Dissophora ornata]KAI8603023.1 hypothetical protein EDD21DRAFT_413432 [Dissophora ornata]